MTAGYAKSQKYEQDVAGWTTNGDWPSPRSHATMFMMKKQSFTALILLLLIPMVWTLGLRLFNLINPESTVGHPDYARNYHFLSLAKHMSLWGSELAVVILWLLVCFLVIRSKRRSSWWLFFGVLGPFGFAVLAALRDRAPAEADRHERFVHNLNTFLRIGYAVCCFVLIWVLADQAVVFKRNLMLQHQSATTGIPIAQIIDSQNASSGMWAFAEGTEEMYLVVLLYLIWPAVFNTVARAAATVTARKALS